MKPAPKKRTGSIAQVRQFYQYSENLEKGWVLILSAASMEIELKCAQLKERGLNAITINKQDSSYLFGETELYVPQDEVIRAKRILDENDQ